MEVKPGYKQTDVGVIPEDWEVTPLGQLGSWKGGATPSMQNSAFWANGTIPWVSSGDVKRSLLFDTPMKITSHAVKNSSTTLLPVDSIIVVVRSGILRKYLPVAKNTLHLAINQDIKALIPAGAYVPDYLLHLIMWCGPRILATCLKSGTTVESVEFRWLKSFAIALPPTKAEQEAIAEALSDADVLIESLEQLLVKKRQLKQGAMQELLTGKKRLPGFSGEWQVKRLGELGGFLKGSGVLRDESASGSLACVRYGELYTRHDDCIKRFYSWISREVAATATRMERGDILFAGSGETKDEIGKCVAFVDDIEAYAGGDIVILRSKKDAPLFLGYYLNTGPINRQKASKGQGDAVVHISAAALADIQCVLPCIPEQTAIATILSDMDAEITTLEAKLSKARQLKQGMMQELLTGRIRLI